MNRKRFLLTSIAILIAFVAGAALSNILQVQSAQAQRAPMTIPKSYGTLKGAVLTSLIFEDSTGTIHLVNLESGGRVAEIRRN
ncbi:MAG: hypothetical protein WAQ99_16555 [Pyrinomonadaceae bacterium]